MSDQTKSRNVLLVFGTGLLAMVLGVGGQGVPVQPDARHYVTVRLVLVDVIAQDRDGRFVTDLNKADFEIYEDGKKMDLGSAELIRLKQGQTALETEPSAVAPAPPEAPRDSRFVVVFDSINTIRRMLDRSKPEILANLLSLLEVGQEIMVFELTEDGRMALLQPLTRDRELIARAVDKATGSIWIEKAADSLIVPSIPEKDGRPAVEGYSFLDRLEQSNQAVFEAESRRRFEKTINGLLGVMNIVKDFEGRKSLLFVSGGIPSLSFIRFFEGGGVADTTAIQSQVAAGKVQDPFKVLGKKGFRTGSEIFDDLVRYANTHNISFYSLDPDNYLRYLLGDIAYDNYPRVAGRSTMGASGIKRPDEIAEIKRSELASLRALSAETGGTAFLGGGKFEEFAQTIERDFGQYYELSYTPKRKKADGKYHKIKVKVLRPGVDIRHRQGFLDYTDEQRESLAFASAAYNPSLFKDIPFEARIVPFAKDRNTFVLWIQTALSVRKILGQEAAADQPMIFKFKLTLDDPSGTSGFLSETAVPIVLIPSLLKRIRSAEYFGWNCASQETEFKPRTYRAVLAIYHREWDLMGTVDSTLEIPDLTKGGAARLLTTSIGKLVKSDKSMVYPFTIARDEGTLEVPNHKFFPMAVPHVPCGERAGFFVQIHSPRNPDTTALSISAVREGNGTAAISLPSGLICEDWNKKTGLWNVLYVLELQTLPPGDYSLAFRWTDPSSSAPIESTLSLRIL